MKKAGIPLAFASEMREIDRVAIEEIGIPGLELMEAAGGKTALGILDLHIGDGETAILCGAGNNGGDGFVVARHLYEADRTVLVCLLADPERLSGDAKTNYERLPEDVPVLLVTMDTLHELRERLKQASCIVDGLLGTGLERNVTGLFAEVITAANDSNATRIAIDIPSGLSSDTGRVMGVAFRADHTYTYGLMKIGQAIYPASSYCGRLELVDIGIPGGVVEQVGYAGILLDEARARQSVKARDPDNHKGAYGHLLIVAGAPGKGGAAVLAAHGGLRSGTGLVTCLTDRQTRLALMSRHPDAMSESLSEIPDEEKAAEFLKIAEGKTAVVFGPGWGMDALNLTLLKTLALERTEIPILLDADALNLIADDGGDFLKKRAEAGGATILTPHPGEAGRLLEITSGEIQKDRPEAIRKIAEHFRSFVVLKGANSIISTPDGRLYVCPFGNPGMATGGTGDVPAGLLGGILATGLDTREALISGTCLHALAGDIAAGMYGLRGLNASDVADAIGTVWRSWESDSDVACENK